MPISSAICFWFLFFSASLSSNIVLFMAKYIYTICNYLSSKKFMTEEERRDIGVRIKNLLISHNLNQADIARDYSIKVGISFEAANVKISRIIRGEFEPNNEFWICLYEKIEANIRFLLTEKGEPHVKPFK